MDEGETSVSPPSSILRYDTSWISVLLMMSFRKK
jgi:hypothetical protein